MKRLIDDTAPSIAVMKESEDWHCLIGGIKSSSTDRNGRTNRVTVVLCGLRKDEARRLTYAILSDWAGSVRKLLEAFQWKREVADEWSVDYEALKSTVKALQEGVSLLEGIPFVNAWERKNDDSNWSKLAKEIREQPFSEEDGIKLVVTGAPSQEAYDEMLKEADRVLWSCEVEKELPRNRPNVKSGKRTIQKQTQTLASGLLSSLVAQAKKLLSSLVARVRDRKVT